jgi:hypothetical protein
MFVESLSNNEIFPNAEGAAFGGFVGAPLLFLVKRLVELACRNHQEDWQTQFAFRLNSFQ